MQSLFKKWATQSAFTDTRPYFSIFTLHTTLKAAQLES